MSGYLSVHWNPHVESGSTTSGAAHICKRVSACLPGWKTVLDRPGLIVFCRPGTNDPDWLCVRAGNSGVVVGPMFRRPTGDILHSTSTLVHELTERESRELLITRGRSLIPSFWGSYVALFSDSEGDASFVLRSPLARVKCFYAQYQDTYCFFSSLDDFAALSLLSLSVNWSCIRAQAASADYLGRETALNEVFSMETGECISISRVGLSRSYYWNPCEIAKEVVTTDFDEAVGILRATTQMCVQTWASYYGTVLHRLSGGLDSSISASCARDVLPRSSIAGVNYYSEDFNGDERSFARDTAERLDIELTEIRRDPDVNLSVFGECGRTAWPVLDFSGYYQYRSEVGLASSRGAKSIFCGELGDNLFENEASREAAKDYVWRHGLRPGLLPIAMDCAGRLSLSVWAVLYRAAAEQVRDAAGRWNSIRVLERTHKLRISDITLLRPEALDSVVGDSARFVHPWLEKAAAGTPPAKFRMICGFWILSAYEPPFSRLGDPPVVAPLASQPLAELCLRIPTYLNNRGSIDRSVARHAFADRLPLSVIWRSTKGTPEPWTRDVVRRNQEFLTSYLAEGILVEKGILDRTRVEAVFSNKIVASKSYIGDLIQNLYIEAWLRRWPSAALRLAA